jgi:hypothetical protein
MLSNGVRVFMGVWHAWVELKIPVTLRMRSDVIAHFPNALVGRAHKRLDALSYAISSTCMIAAVV